MASELYPSERNVSEQEELRQKPPEPPDPKAYLNHKKVVVNAPYSLGRPS